MDLTSNRSFTLADVISNTPIGIGMENRALGSTFRKGEQTKGKLRGGGPRAITLQSTPAAGSSSHQIWRPFGPHPNKSFLCDLLLLNLMFSSEMRLVAVSLHILNHSTRAPFHRKRRVLQETSLKDTGKSIPFEESSRAKLRTPLIQGRRDLGDIGILFS